MQTENQKNLTDINPQPDPAPPAGRNYMPAPATPGKPKSKTIYLVYFGLIIVILVFGYLWLRPETETNQPENPQPTATIQPQNTSLHPIASDSAYLNVKLQITALSNAINAYNPMDPTLSPPILDLPLGFAND